MIHREDTLYIGFLTSELLTVSKGGAMNTRTFSSSTLYFAFPRMTCFPGAPVRRPPGRYACLVPAKQIRSTEPMKGEKNAFVIVFIAALGRQRPSRCLGEPGYSWEHGREYVRRKGCSLDYVT